VARRRWGWWGAVADLGSWPKIAIRLIEGSDKLPAARPAGASLARKGNNLPVLALQHIPELSVENLPVGRRHLQAECVVTVAQQLATNFEPRTAYDGKELSAVISDRPSYAHDTCSSRFPVANAGRRS